MAERSSVPIERVALGSADTSRLFDSVALCIHAACHGGESDEIAQVRSARLGPDQIPARLVDLVRSATNVGGTRAVRFVSLDREVVRDRGGDGPTPVDEFPSPGYLSAADFVHVAIASLFGTPYGFASQQQGRIVNHVAPLRSDAVTANVNSGSQFAFGLHTEDAVHDARPDYLTLRCIRNEARVSTVVSSLCSDDLPDEVWSLLREPAFRQNANRSQGIGLRNRVPSALVTGPIDRPSLRVNTCAFTPDDARTPSHAHAYERLLAVLTNNVVRVVLEAGDILVLDNTAFAHGRDSFVPKFDGTDRWLRRIVVRRTFDDVAELMEPGSFRVRPNDEIETFERVEVGS
jgi:L-asparagine oxygenase